MKVEEVPQDVGYLKDSNLRDIYYALDDSGSYCQVASIGWQPRTEALSLVWEHISEEADEIRQDVLQGKKSPLAYHMKIRLFDAGIMASYSGISKKTVKKHLQPTEFERLDDMFLQKYADILSMEVEELKKV
ncbi:MAG: hypothetical protein LBS09_08050 [Bacteroidales bacterium]|jgi:hypothetical protein|nr:hypothetical protein [Bacteroidales bacterium]